MATSKLLFVEDDQSFASVTSTLLRRNGFLVKVCNDLTEAREALYQEKFDLLLTDWNLPDGKSHDLISWLPTLQRNCATIVLTGHQEPKVANEILQAGVSNFLLKPIRTQELIAAIQRALSQRSSLSLQSRAWQRTHSLLLAASSAPKTTLLLRGESGVGKEVAAKSVHQMSARGGGPYVTANAACFPENLLESELFGYEPGAFTGAQKSKRGLFEMASGGTLFLDEIGELPLSLQAKLLRVLEGHPFRRLGGESELHPDVRLICATNAPLEELVKKNLFRADLYHRLRVFEVQLPPLRERIEDIEPLALHFLRTLSPSELNTLSPEVIQIFKRHPWPGNIRELRNTIEHALVLSRGADISPEHLPKDLLLPRLHPYHKQPENALTSEDESLDAHIRQHILEVFARAENNLTRAALRLKISRTTLRKYLKEYGVCAAKLGVDNL